VENPEGLLPRDAALVGAEQGVLAPLDTAYPRCGPNGLGSEHSPGEVLMSGKLQPV
jgi:hypothetical protein